LDYNSNKYKNKNMDNNDIPTIFAIFGATGDLMTKKIVPALFSLHKKGTLPKKFRILGISRREWNQDDFKKHIENIISIKIEDAKENEIESFLKLIQYQKVEFNTIEDYFVLGDVFQKIDEEWNVCANKLLYLSVPPQFYDTILDNISKSHLSKGCGIGEGWTRIVVEKPFGNNEKSAKTLDAKLSKIFKEEQIYRIDHYLAKEMLQNILAFRFGNDIFEDEWNNKFIEKINIRLFEDIGVEDRGGFYDGVGTLRDVGQNHLLAMLALTTMERPENYDSNSIRKSRANLLRMLEIPSVSEAKKRSFRAQYEGYREIKGVDSNSSTETYFKIKGFLTGQRWEGVPIVMESGKKMGAPLKEIEIIFNHDTPLFSKQFENNILKKTGKYNDFKNRIIIRIEPKEEITIIFYLKEQGYFFNIEERSLNFSFRKEGVKHIQYTEEYEKLLLDCVLGDQTLFVSSDEISAMWKFIDPFILAWEKNLTPLKKYSPNSDAIVAEANFLENENNEVITIPQEIGIFGLGKMGANVARQLHKKGWNVFVSNRSEAPIKLFEKEGIKTSYSIEDLMSKYSYSPRVIWVMITAGKGVDDILFGKNGIVSQLKKGDILIDAGNSFYKDTIRRGKILSKKGIHFVDVGFSGGPSGALNGGCLMVGGENKIYEYLEPLFKAVSVSSGYGYFGSCGAGHFVKMVHNGIEYGMMQSIAEGFALIKKSHFDIDIHKVAEIYNRGSVVESRLVGWLEDAFRIYGNDLNDVSGSVDYTGEGEWTVLTAKSMRMKLQAIEDAFKFRVQSRKNPSYMGKILSAMRNRFGGHSIEKSKK
jgi:glucose-6-phosphate 1-dehydrogenase